MNREQASKSANAPGGGSQYCEVNVRPDEREGEEPVSAPREAAMQGFNKADQASEPIRGLGDKASTRKAREGDKPGACALRHTRVARTWGEGA